MWGPRFSAYVVAKSDLAVFTLGRLPEEKRPLTRARDLATRLTAVLAGTRMLHGDAARAVGAKHANELRYAAPTGTVLIRWDGARQPELWNVPAPAVDPREARLELARRYLHVFGPATPEGFATWAGIRPASAKAAFAALGDGHGTRAQTAIRFALANGDLSCVVVGMAELDHLEAQSSDERRPTVAFTPPMLGPHARQDEARRSAGQHVSGFGGVRQSGQRVVGRQHRNDAAVALDGFRQLEPFPSRRERVHRARLGAPEVRAPPKTPALRRRGHQVQVFHRGESGLGSRPSQALNRALLPAVRPRRPPFWGGIARSA